MLLDPPEYACAIISASDGRRLLQLRPADARHAPGQLTCFGGAREPWESAETCLERELHEELGWRPGSLRAVCDLRQGTRHIARFFHCVMPARSAVRTEPGHLALWVPTSALPGLPLSPWHRLVLEAVDQGRTVVELPS
ncbi:MAG: NUDIX domain-containing protein [Planctomycetes bacterium]|jgi:8-oxo-dGTP pyrophosphatase MutT (NUDIX family)|nr:NUDIX domain-containing protein [Planctomycetota bacterium]